MATTIPPTTTRLFQLIAAILLVPILLLVSGCSEPKATETSTVESIKIDGKVFHLELALDGPTRYLGLSNRTYIEPDGGMLFVFSKPSVQRFVMRDCPTDIDIIFLDPSARITAMYHMPVEEDRRPDEPETDNPADDKYEQRLGRYSSKFASQFVIELAGGTLKNLDLHEGDQIDLDTKELKARAK